MSCAYKIHNFPTRIFIISTYTCILFFWLSCNQSIHWNFAIPFSIHQDTVYTRGSTASCRCTHHLNPQSKSNVTKQTDQGYPHYKKVHLKQDLIYILLFQKLRKQFLQLQPTMSCYCQNCLPHKTLLPSADCIKTLSYAEHGFLAVEKQVGSIPHGLCPLRS